MTSLGTLVVIAVVILAVLTFFCRRCGACCQAKERGSAEPIVPANEAGPTQTGKYRVDQMLQRTGGTSDNRETPQPETKQVSAGKTSEVVLPDPFSLPEEPGDKK